MHSPNCLVCAHKMVVFGKLPWWLRWWRNCLQCKRPGFDSWVGKIPWRRKWQSTSVFLSGEFHRQEFSVREESVISEQLSLSLLGVLSETRWTGILVLCFTDIKFPDSGLSLKSRRKSEWKWPTHSTERKIHLINCVFKSTYFRNYCIFKNICS